MLEPLAERVRSRRRALRLTQQQVADLAETGRRAVIDLEAGRGTISLSRAARVCDVLGLRLEVR
jgi:HTH-type transcriptional regulator / antitoxin HipB